MTFGVIGQKCGMTRLFMDDGRSVPVTVVLVPSNRISSIKRKDVDGYDAIQVAWGEKKLSRLNKPQSGVLAKAEIGSVNGLCEFRLSFDTDFSIGQSLSVDMFSVGQKVDVTGQSIGKGFAGTVKRHNFRMGDASHGNSLSHRTSGSIGQCQYPGKVFKGKKMSGHMGHVRRTIQNLEVLRIETKQGLLLIKGGVPGSKGTWLAVRSSVKRKNRSIGDAA